MYTPNQAFIGQPVTRQNINSFIPNLWAWEIRHYRDASFVMENTCKTFNFVGQKGDTAHVPLVGRAAVYNMVPGQPVRLQVFTPGQYQVKVDQYKESSYGIQDIVKIQSQYETRQPFSKEIGYAMTRDLDNALLALRAAIPTNQWIFSSSTSTAAGDPEPITTDVVLAAHDLMLAQDVPLTECRWIVGTQQYVDLLNVDKFINYDFTANRPVDTGVIGSLYGVPVIMTSNLTYNTLIGYQNGEDAPLEPTPGVVGSPYLPTQQTMVAGGLPRGKTGSEVASPFQTAMLVHPDWAVLLKQKNISTTSSFENLYQMDALVTTHIYGAKTYRSDHVVLVHSGRG